MTSAEQLYRSGDFDSAISRAYYAMFLLAEAALLARGIVATSHRAVIRLFGQVLVRSGDLPAELGRALARAYDARLRSDYAVGLWATAEEAADILEVACRFVSELEHFLDQQ